MLRAISALTFANAEDVHPRSVRSAAANALAIGAATAVVGCVTVATRVGWIGVRELAATPDAVARGKVWLLLTSCLVADRPWLPSLLGFALVGITAFSVERAVVVALAALAGHVLATLVVYGLLGAVRAADHDAFASLVDQPDVGLSAIIAAWIGVVAAVPGAVTVRRGPTR